ncbi:Uncharacterised protein [Mycobacteroides abscessus subsp. abscessus]|nr:Uncharacterised protein [Mycobacteroides abscessus subsp. abscessus]SKV63759.1 Uncharacterised protein [Mycobacteroides abscessus subsp. abscessus]
MGASSRSPKSSASTEAITCASRATSSQRRNDVATPARS